MPLRSNLCRAALPFLFWSLLPASGLADNQPAPAAPPKFAIPGSAESASRGGKAGPKDALSKAKRQGVRANGKPRPGAAIATFPGFRMLPDGGSRIYIDLSKSVSVDEHVRDGALVLTLRDAQVLAKNNKNALITTHFPAAASRARLVPAGNDVNLVIDLRKPVTATHRVTPGENGAARLEVDFPPGDYPLEPGRYQPVSGGRYRTQTSRAADENDLPETVDDSAPAPSAAPVPSKPPADNPGVGPPTP